MRLKCWHGLGEATTHIDKIYSRSFNMAVGSVATGPRSLENAVSAADTTPPSSAVEVSRQRAINPPRSRTARWNLLSRSRSGAASADQASTSTASPDSHDSLLLFAPEAP